MINISSNKLSIGFLLKNTFNAYYLVDIEKLMKREDTIFVFDTNVLLNLYSYTEETREDFFSLLNVIKDRIWIPYHVALEYQRNRLTVIRNEKKIFKELDNYISNIKKNLDTTSLQSLKLKQRLPKLHEETIQLQEKIIKKLDAYSESVNKWDKKQPCVRSEDSIREKIDEIFDNKIGEIPENQKYLDNLYRLGEERYKNKIPPGYEDEKDKKDKNIFKYNNLEYIPMYGDYIIWEQLISEVEKRDLKSLLFITDDVKEDWLYLIDSNGKKEIGPRIELVDEILNKTNIELFHIMKSSDFLTNGKKHLNTKIKDDSIEEVNENFDIKQTYYFDNQIIESKIRDISSSILKQKFLKQGLVNPDGREDWLDIKEKAISSENLEKDSKLLLESKESNENLFFDLWKKGLIKSDLLNKKYLSDLFLKGLIKPGELNKEQISELLKLFKK